MYSMMYSMMYSLYAIRPVSFPVCRRMLQLEAKVAILQVETNTRHIAMGYIEVATAVVGSREIVR